MFGMSLNMKTQLFFEPFELQNELGKLRYRNVFEVT